MSKPALITVLGSGISGLTTALCLLEKGYRVGIWSKEAFHQTTSFVAAAIWFPYSAKPIDKVNQWSFETYDFLHGLAQLDNSGVQMIDFLILSRKDWKDKWRNALPTHAVREAGRKQLPRGYQKGYIAKVPLADSSRYLPYLFNQIKSKGGTFEQIELESTDQLNKEGTIYINCTGMGSKSLFDDELLYPVRGQVLSIPKKVKLKSMVDSIVPGSLAYIIEREQDYIIGGTDYDNDYNQNALPEDSKQIIERCTRLQPKLQVSDNYKAKVGLRPKRYSIRCEWDKSLKLIHNYGHGGAGYTVSWGCANEVARLLEERI